MIECLEIKCIVTLRLINNCLNQKWKTVELSNVSKERTDWPLAVSDKQKLNDSNQVIQTFAQHSIYYLPQSNLTEANITLNYSQFILFNCPSFSLSKAALQMWLGSLNFIVQLVNWTGATKHKI